MKLLYLILAVTASALLAGCSTLDPAAHNAKVAALRNRTPYLTRIGLTHSMSTVVVAGSTRMVSPLPYPQLQSGMAGVFWPIGAPTPVCHFVGRRIGTDSWSTVGMNSSAQGGPVTSDVSSLGYLLTRENYIGVIK